MMSCRSENDNLSLHELFEASMRQSPTAKCLLFDDGSKYNYTEVFCFVDEVVLFVQTTIGSNCTQRFVILIAKDINVAFFSLMIGLMKCGYAFVALENSNNLKLVADLMPGCWIIADYEHSDLSIRAKIAGVNISLGKNTRYGNPKLTPNELGDDVVDKKFAYAIFTSGSTGSPKLIKVSHRCVVPNIIDLRRIYNITADDVVLLLTPITFDPSIVEIFLALSSGSAIYVISPRNRALVTSLPQQATILFTTPSLFAKWPEGTLVKSSLRIFSLGGEPFPRGLLLLNIRAWLLSDTRRRAFNLYGITEVSCWASVCELSRIDGEREVPLGQPLSETVFKILDDGGCELESDNVIGHLLVGSATRTCEVVTCEDQKVMPPIILETVNTRNVYFRETGDIVRMRMRGDEKLYFYVSRNDSKVKILGTQVDTKFVESFVRNLDYVVDCVCESDGRGNLMLLVQGDVGRRKIIENGVGNELFEHLDNHARPNLILLVSQLPLNSHGKVSRKNCLQLLTEHKFNNFITNGSELLTKLWSKYVNTRSPNAGFISSGGDSVAAIQLVSEFSARYNSPRDLLSTLLRDGNLSQCLALPTNTCADVDREIKLNSDGNYAIIPEWRVSYSKCVDATPLAVVDYPGSGSSAIICCGCHSGEIRCVNAETGSAISSTFLCDRIQSSCVPSIDKTKFYVGCFDGGTYCVRIDDCAIEWIYFAEQEVKSAPLLYRDFLFVPSYDHYLHAIDSRDGSLRWKVIVDGDCLSSTPAIVPKREAVVVTTLGGTVACYSAESGAMISTIKLDNPIFCSPLVIDEDSVIVAQVTGMVHRLRLDQSAFVTMWRLQCDGNIFSNPISNGDSTSIFFGCYDRHVYCVNTFDGAVKWKSEKLDATIYASLVLLAEILVACASDGTVYMLQSEDGVTLAKRLFEGTIFSSPINVGSRIYFGSRDNNLNCARISKPRQINH